MRLLALVAIVLGTAACYEPSFGDCKVSCSALGGCPSGYTCGSGYCFPIGEDEPSCPAQDPDAGLVDAEPDASPDAMIPGAALRGLSGGYAFTCGLDPDDHLLCWGENRYGQLGQGGISTRALIPDAIAGSVQAFSQVVTGYTFACGLARDTGVAICWGENGYGQLGRDQGFGGIGGMPTAVATIPSTEPWSALAASADHACGINAGRLFCWGAGDRGQLGDGLGISQDHPVRVGTGTDWVQVSVGTWHTCGVRDDGATRALYCWGSPYALGQDPMPGPDVTAPTVETAPPIGKTWRSVTAGRAVTCAIDSDQDLWCWGDNSTKIIAPSAVTGLNALPVRVDDTRAWDTVSLGEFHACGRADAAAFCWGASDIGQSGIRVATVGITTIPGAFSEVMAAASGFHSCGVRADGAACWGLNHAGQLGGGVAGDGIALQEVEVAGAPDKPWLHVVAGAENTCAIAADDGAVWCWGLDNGVLRGVGDQTRPHLMDEVGTGASMLALDYYHACAIKSDQSLVCWGNNGDGQLGNGGAGAALEVTNGGQWLDVGVAITSTCAIKMDRTLWCWGSDASGLLADPGSTSNRISPHLVPGTNVDWTELAVGQAHACATRLDGSAACWGWNEGYAVDDANLSAVIQVPTDLTGTGWSSIDVSSGSGGHSAGLIAGARLGWGTGEYGRIGVGIITFPVTTPTSLALDTADWEATSSGGGHGCGLRNGGQLWCWGYEGDLPLASGGYVGTYEPERLGAGVNWREVSAGLYHSCAIDVDQQLWCWGQNGSLQLGAGLGFSAAPVLVVPAG